MRAACAALLAAGMLACGGPPSSGEPAAAALAAGGEDPSECAALAFEELRVTCWVSAAARSAGAGDDDGARAACAEIPAGLWREECHFRAGEEHGRRAALEPALWHCARAGGFAPNCLTHSTWNLPPTPGLRPDGPDASASLAAFEASVDAYLGALGGPLIREARDALIARAWFNLYYGSGSAAPGPARASDSPAARTAWALEADRLLGGADELALLQAWTGEAPAPAGAPLGPGVPRAGQFAPSVLPVAHRDRPRTAVFGGGTRLVGGDLTADLVSAWLAARFFHRAPSSTFLPWIEDARPEIRDSAVTWAVLAAREEESTIDAMLALPSDTARAYAREALRLRKTRRSGPGGRPPGGP